MFPYYDKVVRGTEREDSHVILQSLSGMIGQTFSFLNYYKEIPVSYDATLLNVENEMAEFAVHEYQAKVINMEKNTLIYSHNLSDFPDDLIGEAFYVSSAKKRVILCNFSYAKIRSNMRQFVRVLLASPIAAVLHFEDTTLKGDVKDISLGGAAVNIMSADLLHQGLEIKIVMMLPDLSGESKHEVDISAVIVKVEGMCAPFTCFVEFYSDKHSQQQIAYYINQRQVEIIKDLKDLNL